MKIESVVVFMFFSNLFLTSVEEKHAIEALKYIFILFLFVWLVTFEGPSLRSPLLELRVRVSV